jgi:hypothetical protein
VECDLLTAVHAWLAQPDLNLMGASLVSGRPSVTLPWPDEWSTPKRIRWSIAFSYLGLMGAASLYFGAAGLAAGEHKHVPLLLLGGALGLIIATQGALTRVLVRRGVISTIRTSTLPETGEAAVVFPYSASQFWLSSARRP